MPPVGLGLALCRESDQFSLMAEPQQVTCGNCQFVFPVLHTIRNQPAVCPRCYKVTTLRGSPPGGPPPTAPPQNVSSDTQITVCPHCNKSFSFTKEQSGTTVICPHCRKNVMPIYGPAKDDDVFGFVLLAGLLSLIAGIGFVAYYFWFYPLNAADSDILNAGRMHKSLCGIIIGIGLSRGGAVVSAICFLADWHSKTSRQII